MPNKTYALEDLNIDDIITISDYYETDRYPGPRYVMPSRSEVEYFFMVAEKLFQQINAFIDV